MHFIIADYHHRHLHRHHCQVVEKLSSVEAVVIIPFVRQPDQVHPQDDHDDDDDSDDENYDNDRIIIMPFVVILPPSSYGIFITFAITILLLIFLLTIVPMLD